MVTRSWFHKTIITAISPLASSDGDKWEYLPLWCSLHFCGIGGYEVMNTAVPYVWEPRYCHQNFVGQQNGLVTAQVLRYLWVPWYRLSSEILITGKVEYQRAKPGCQAPAWFQIPTVPKHRMGTAVSVGSWDSGPNAQSSISSIFFPSDDAKRKI